MTAFSAWILYLCAMSLPRNSLALHETRRWQGRSAAGFSLTSRRSCLVSLCSRASSYRPGSFATASTLEMFSSVRTVCSTLPMGRASALRACSRGVRHWFHLSPGPGWQA